MAARTTTAIALTPTSPTAMPTDRSTVIRPRGRRSTLGTTIAITRAIAGATVGVTTIAGVTTGAAVIVTIGAIGTATRAGIPPGPGRRAIRDTEKPATRPACANGRYGQRARGQAYPVRRA